MAEWTYLLVQVGGADAVRGRLLRRPTDGPVTLAEELLDDGRWEPTDLLFRIKYQGADDNTRPVEPDVAELLIAEWIQHGRLPGPPDPSSSIDPATRERLVEADRLARERWAQVTPPPGAESIQF